MATASEILLSASTAASGSTASVHLKSAEARATRLGLHLSAQVETSSISNVLGAASSNLESTISSNASGALSANITTTLEASTC